MRFDNIAVTVTVVLITTAAYRDIRDNKIPNYLTYPAILTGIALSLWPNVPPEIGAGLTGLAIGFTPAFLLFVLGTIGGGDVKLLAALGALLGFPMIMDVMFYAIVAGSVMGLALIVWRGRIMETLRGFFNLLVSLVYPGMHKIVPLTDLRVPFGVAIALGTFWVIFAPTTAGVPMLTDLLGLG